jgi:competence ComEA-like helix-hairpin-helix protein
LEQATDISSSESKISQRQSFLLACLLAAALAGVFAWSLTQKERAVRLVIDDKINPNTATVASLMRLPGIGQARAEAIVALRQKELSDTNAPAFSSAKDLRQVRGIGPKTARNISDSLTFEGGQPNGN